MTRSATNSLILTNIEGKLKSPQVLAKLLASRAIQAELVYLPRFERYIVICPNNKISEETKQFLEETMEPSIRISFSLRDNPLCLPRDDSWALKSRPEEMDFLELPLEEGSKRFLILPPLSPQSEWDDFDKVEDGPNKRAIYSPDELAHLLWDRLGGFQSPHIRKFQDDDNNAEALEEWNSEYKESPIYDMVTEKSVIFEDLPAGVPAIVVDKVINRDSSPKKSIPKTAIPPKLES